MASIDDLVTQVTELTYATTDLTELVNGQLARLTLAIDNVDAKADTIIAAADEATEGARQATEAATQTAADVVTITGLVEQNVFAPSYIELSTNLITTQNLIVTMHPTF